MYNEYVNDTSSKVFTGEELEKTVINYLYFNSGIFTEEDLHRLHFVHTAPRCGLRYRRTHDTSSSVILALLKCSKLNSAIINNKKHAKLYAEKFPAFNERLRYILLRITSDVNFKAIHYLTSSTGFSDADATWPVELFGNTSTMKKIKNTLDVCEKENKKLYNLIISLFEEKNNIINLIRITQDNNTAQGGEPESTRFFAIDKNCKLTYALFVPPMKEKIKNCNELTDMQIKISHKLLDDSLEYCQKNVGYSFNSFNRLIKSLFVVLTQPTIAQTNNIAKKKGKK